MPFFGASLDGGWGSTSATTTSNNYVYCTISSSATSCTNSLYNSQMANAATYQSALNTYFWHDPRPAEQAAALKAHPKAAQNRARELLLSQLSEEQRRTFEKNGWFIVEGGKSKRRYRIAANDNMVANIAVLDGERVIHRLCGHCDVSKVPLSDHLLAQKLMLESAEDDFLRVANRHAA